MDVNLAEILKCQNSLIVYNSLRFRDLMSGVCNAILLGALAAKLR